MIKLILMLCIIFYAIDLKACTTILVSNKASSDGSFMVGRNVDSEASNAPIFKINPEKNNNSSFYSLKEFDNGLNNFKWPLPKTTMRYTSMPDWTNKHTYGEDGFNSAGVGVSGTETVFANEKVLKIDPYNTKDGISEASLIDVILPVAKSAKEGVILLGRIIEEVGTAEGMGVAFVDDKEIWYLETGSGHQFLARKLPDKDYFVSANQIRLREYDANSSNFLASKNLIKVAIEAKTYDPKKDGRFDFFKAYSKDDHDDKTYNYPRVWWLEKMYNPNLDQNISSNLPVFLSPQKPISLNEVKAGLRSHYDGTKFDYYQTGDFKNNIFRPISVFRTYQSSILQVRPWLPKDIGLINYICLGMADIGVYLPYYYGINSYIDGYDSGTNKADNISIYWKYRKLQTLVMQNYKKYASIVKRAYKEFEQNLANDQIIMEAKYIEIYKNDPKSANKFLNEWTKNMMNQALFLTTNLTNEIFTLLTNDTDERFKALNNGKKD